MAIITRDDPPRAALEDGPDVWEVILMAQIQAADMLGLTPTQVREAFLHYAENPRTIETRILENRKAEWGVRD